MEAFLIIVCLRGGLGNQLFQYAFARFIARKHNTQLWINTWFYTSYDDPSRRRFELSQFNIFCQQICDQDWSDEEKLKSNLDLNFVKDTGRFQEDLKQIEKLGDNVILIGWWSTFTGYLFTRDFHELIRREITLRNKIEDDAFNQFDGKIAGASNSVAVHIRRGDYKLNQHLFVQLDEAYYKRAFDLMERNITAPEYFIFSDEIEWVENNFSFSHDVQFVKGGTTISDFELMKRCRHYIASNSTYSWWAAYLNDNNEKIVVVPKKYYEHEIWQSSYEEAENGYMPPTWVRV